MNNNKNIKDVQDFSPDTHLQQHAAYHKINRV